MKYEIKECSGCGYTKPIINVKYNLCLKCNRDRLNRIEDANRGNTERHKSITHKKGTNTPLRKKRARIKPISINKKVENEKYIKVKAQKRKDMIEGGYFRCFFTGKELDPNGKEDWHHVLFRSQYPEEATSYKNIFPCLRQPHDDFHHKDVEWLLKNTYWYRNFFDRIKEINHKAYNQELERMLKAKMISMETYLNERK